jgi:GTP pyrophosphokinase
MHRVAEFGIAAHWKYKGGQAVGAVEAQRFAWLRQLLEWQQNVSDPQEFLGSVKETCSATRSSSSPPRADVLNFPEGASVIDFAYRIHSEVGHHCTGARVNGRLVPLRYRLRNGDTVEIVTTTNQTPSKDWLNHVQTSRTKARIRPAALPTAQPFTGGGARDPGARPGAPSARLQAPAEGGQAHRGGARAVAKGRGDADRRRRLRQDHHAQVLGKLLPAEELARRAEREEGTLRKLFRRMVGQGAGVQVSGVETCWCASASAATRCPAKRILGFITRGRGVTCTPSTARACWRAIRSAASKWCGRAAPTEPVPVNLEVVCVDEPGMLAAITKSISAPASTSPGAGAEHARQAGAEQLRDHGRNGRSVEQGDPRRCRGKAFAA